MSLFAQSEEALDSLRGLNEETLEAPKSRIGSPAAVRGLYERQKEEDSDSAFNRALVQGLMDFTPPHDDKELEDKGQSDRFNITTGEGPAIKNEAVAAFMDIYTTPKVLAQIPLKDEVDKQYADTYAKIMAEEYTKMDRSNDASLPSFNLLCDTYVTHGVVIPYFDDEETLDYSVGGLDHFKFPRKTGIITSKVELCTAVGYYGVAELYGKIGMDGWDERAIRLAITQSTEKAGMKEWNDWEKVQQEIKSNEAYIDYICDRVEVVHCWVKEFDGKISYYVAARTALCDKNDGPEPFIYQKQGRYESMSRFLQIMAFSVGNGGLLYTVRGLGYPIYQLCNAMDILHCKLLDNARVGSSLILQPASTEDAQDMMIIDSGAALMIPPTMKVPERPMGQDLNKTIVPAINESRGVMNRATGGLAAGNALLNDDADRETKLEVSSKLDYINKLNSFAINLFYGPLDNITKEKVRRAFQVRQKRPEHAKLVKEMKERCIARGVPKEMFDLIDIDNVKASRIIGTGSRASRIMLMDQMQQMYSTWDAVGRANFEYDYLCELVGPEKAERYAGKPNEVRSTYDDSIAMLENFQLLEGDWVEVLDGQNHMVHLSKHVPELTESLKGVDEGQIDLMSWTMEHNMLYQHCIATLEVTTVHETVEPELNSYRQQVQQVGELVVNGLKMLNKQTREEQEAAAGPDGDSDEAIAARKAQQEMEISDAKHKQKMQQIYEAGVLKLQMEKKAGEWKQVAEAQKAMAGIAMKDAEVQTQMARRRATAL